MKKLSTFIRRGLAVVVGLLWTLWAWAAEPAKPWPEARPITWVVGYAPGGTVDVTTRAIAKVVAEKIGQSIVVDVRPGGSGAVALQFAAHARADGYTLVTMVGPALHDPHQPEIGRELSAISLLSQGPIVMVGQASQAPANLQELIAAMKTKPADWSFATSGQGSAQHLSGELFNQMAGTRMVHVPYKGGGQAVGDVVGGQVALGMLGVTPVLPFIKSGQLKAYAVTTRFRHPALPAVPTMEEAGLRGYDLSQYLAVAAPAGTPAAVVSKLNAAIAQAMRTPEVKAVLEKAGQSGEDLSPRETQDFIARSSANFDRIARNIKPDLPHTHSTK